MDGYDHTPWLDLYKFYIAAFKAGTYPAITADRTFVWGRTYRRDAVATNDVLSPPDHYTWVRTSILPSFSLVLTSSWFFATSNID